MGTVYPDFTILHQRLRKEIYWEHLGMMDDAAYAENTFRRLAAYLQSGYFPGDRLMVSWETSLQPLNIRLIQSMIRQMLR